MKDLADIHFSAARTIVLVQDNLSIHSKASLYQAFPAAEARSWYINLMNPPLVWIYESHRAVCGNLLKGMTIIKLFYCEQFAGVVPCVSSMDEEALKREILAHCQERLERHKTPATIRFVESLDLSAAGKLKREAARD